MSALPNTHRLRRLVLAAFWPEQSEFPSFTELQSDEIRPTFQPMTGKSGVAWFETPASVVELHLSEDCGGLVFQNWLTGPQSCWYFCQTANSCRTCVS